MVSDMVLFNSVEEVMTKNRYFKVIEEICDEVKINPINHPILDRNFQIRDYTRSSAKISINHHEKSFF